MVKTFMYHGRNIVSLAILHSQGQFRGLSLLAKVIVHNCPEVLGFNRSQKPSDSEVFDVVEAQNQGAIVNNYRRQRA